MRPAVEPQRPGASIRQALRRLRIRTGEAPSFHDLTEAVIEFIGEVGVRSGQITIQALHTTAAIIINEAEPLLLEDMRQFLERLAPRAGTYRHNDLAARGDVPPDERPNAHAHLQHLLLGAVQQLPIVDGRPALGRWQRIMLVELDHPRRREVLLSILGAGEV